MEEDGGGSEDGEWRREREGERNMHKLVHCTCTCTLCIL